MIAARIARSTGQVLLGLLIWPFLLPLGVKRIYHIARRLVRKLVKPAALWWTVRQLRRAEAQADAYMRGRASLRLLEQDERIRTVRLTGRRNQIRGW